MNLSDTFYVALCMTVLILGVVYWFWTQNQYIQRKLNLLENIVYDMKSSMNFNGGRDAPDPVKEVLAAAQSAAQTHSDVSSGHGLAAAEYTHIHDSVEEVDDVDKILDSMVTHDAHGSDSHFERDVSAPTMIVTETMGDGIVADEHLDDLQPGGITLVGDDVSDTSNESVLNAMGLKELRELAKQKNIASSKTMRKHELVAAIRASKTHVTPFEIREGTLDLN